MRGYHVSRERDDGFELAIPFLIDGDAYSGRERMAFVLGFEFCNIYASIRDPSDDGDRVTATVHRANEDRSRLMCQRLGRTGRFTPIDATWLELEIDPR